MTEEKRKTPRNSLFNNYLSIIGFGIAVLFLVGQSVIIIIDLIQGTPNAYIGILIYVVGPSILVFGLALVPVGMFLEHRRRIRGIQNPPFPVIDLGNSTHRMKILVFTSITLVFLILTSVGSYKAYHITESNEFCGLMCHQVMVPEYTAYQSSPHARVDCVQCHIGPGADWFVRSKLSGTRQLIAVVTNSYELPIETPIQNLRPARDTCEQCHWPEKFYDAVEKQMMFYGTDEENTPYRVDMLLHVGQNPQSGNPTRGIHWHIGLDHKMEYYATDHDRQEIPWVRVTYEDGRVEEFVDEDAEGFDPAAIPPDEIRTMDCIDCHNRPSHRFNSPFKSVNESIMHNRLDPTLPDLKATLVELLNDDYETTDGALQSIEETIRSNYEELIAENAEKAASVDQAVAETQDIFKKNFFPEWKTNWTNHNWNIGHFEFPGCYRCHDDKHKAVNSEKAIRFECRQCHTIIRQGEGWDEVAALEYKEQKFYHPRGFGDDWEGQNCHECHGPGMM